MSCTNRLIEYAAKLDRPIQVERNQSYKYKVTIQNVVLKDKHLRVNIAGYGFTIEDACYDFLRKSHGLELENYMTNGIIKIL